MEKQHRNSMVQLAEVHKATAAALAAAASPPPSRRSRRSSADGGRGDSRGRPKSSYQYDRRRSIEASQATKQVASTTAGLIGQAQEVRR